MMKRLVLLAAIVISTLSMNAQEVNLGISGALPVGDAEDVSSFGLNLDLNYLTGVTERLDLGFTTGYHHYFGDDYDVLGITIESEDFGFLPLAAAARFNVNESFALGGDIGYAIGINPDGNDGGFYYAPKLQYALNESLDIVLAYRGVSIEDSIDFNSITLGVEFGL